MERDLRWGALRYLWDASELQSQRACSVAPVLDTMVEIRKRDRHAVFHGLVRCNRLDCPVCGPSIAEREAANLELAITEHVARGGTVALVTLTMRHTRAERLLSLLVDLGKAWTSARTSKAPRALWAAHTDGYVRKLETTNGANGWHPHLHLLVFLKPGVTPEQAIELAHAAFSSWQRSLVRNGRGEPDLEHGVDVQVLDLDAAHEAVAGYVAKDAGRELASAGTKRGRRATQRTTFEILLDAAAGDGRSQLLFAEYEDAMRGRHRIEWSAGLKEQLLDVELLADADPESQGRTIAYLDGETWSVVIRNERYGLGPGRLQLLHWVELHDDDAEAFDCLWRQCKRHGIPPPSPGPGIEWHPPPPPPRPQLSL